MWVKIWFWHLSINRSPRLLLGLLCAQTRVEEWGRITGGCMVCQIFKLYPVYMSLWFTKNVYVPVMWCITRIYTKGIFSTKLFWTLIHTFRSVTLTHIQFLWLWLTFSFCDSDSHSLFVTLTHTHRLWLLLTLSVCVSDFHSSSVTHTHTHRL